MLSSLVLILSAICFVSAADPAGSDGGSTDARILASKFLLSNYAVEGKEFVVEYSLYNVGDKAAIKVTLDDSANFPSSHYEIVKGLLSVEWERIAPGSNVSHSVILKPAFIGRVNYTAADISYLASEAATTPRKASTSAPGEGVVYRLRDYERKFSPRYGDWGFFILLASPSVLLPGLLWCRSKNKYQRLSTKEKKHS